MHYKTFTNKYKLITEEYINYCYLDSKCVVCKIEFTYVQFVPHQFQILSSFAKKLLEVIMVAKIKNTLLHDELQSSSVQYV